MAATPAVTYNARHHGSLVRGEKTNHYLGSSCGSGPNSRKYLAVGETGHAGALVQVKRAQV